LRPMAETELCAGSVRRALEILARSREGSTNMILTIRQQRDHKGIVANPCLGDNNQSRVCTHQKSKQFPLFTFSDKAARYHKGQIANPCLGRRQPHQSSYAPEKQAVPPLQTTSMNVYLDFVPGAKSTYNVMIHDKV
jgi:hypothetical protein